MLPWALLAIALVALAVALALERREAARMARFLRERDPGSNARLTVGLPGRQRAELVRAVNAQLDAVDAERREVRMQHERFQRDLASLSHDIRTPLAGAKGYLQLAEGERDLARREHCARMAAERLDAMQVMLDQLFAYTRAADPEVQLDVRAVRLVPVLETVLAASFPAFEERGWQPSIQVADPALEVLADEEALRRILENAVQNALAHGCGALVVSQEGSALVFENPVADAGAIDEERLFERFYRADAARNAPGAGLGLAVVRSLAEAMGASATAAVTEGAFRLELRFRTANGL